jgi:hypothetical protein
VPTFVKMDIEGCELEALQGMRETIKRSHPILAVCLEHRQEDIWTVPLYLQSLAGDYRFFLRPHLEEVWDLVGYAIPAARLPR